MKTTLNSINLSWIPQYSVYCHNYYIDILTGKIILAISDDEDTTGYFYTSVENMQNGTHKNEELIGYAYDGDFNVPTCYDRFRGGVSKERAQEYSHEFDNEII